MMKIIVENQIKNSKTTDFFYFYSLKPNETELPVYIWIDVGTAYKTAKMKLRIKFCPECKGDRDIFEMDIDGNIYSLNPDNCLMLSEDDCAEIKIWFRNNRYALRKISEEKIGAYYILPYMIKGGQIATRAEKKKLREKTDELTWKNEEWKNEMKRRVDKILNENNMMSNLTTIQ